MTQTATIDPMTNTVYIVTFAASTEGNWCSQCAGRVYATREAAQAAIDDDETAKPDEHGNSCRPAIEPVQIDTVSDLARHAAGGVCTNDRGQGSAGPQWIGEGLEEIEEHAGTPIAPVTEADDPGAWRLAREAVRLLTDDNESEPELVCVGEAVSDSDYQLIWIA